MKEEKRKCSRTSGDGTRKVVAFLAVTRCKEEEFKSE